MTSWQTACSRLIAKNAANFIEQHNHSSSRVNMQIQHWLAAYTHPKTILESSFTQISQARQAEHTLEQARQRQKPALKPVKRRSKASIKSAHGQPTWSQATAHGWNESKSLQLLLWTFITMWAVRGSCAWNFLCINNLKSKGFMALSWMLLTSKSSNP